MILGIGTDIVDIVRLRKMHERHGERLLSRILTPKEKECCLKYKNIYPHLAGKFAVKEAVVKAVSSCLGKKFCWTDIEVVNHNSGKPSVVLHNGFLDLFVKMDADIFVTVAHTRKYAVATVIIESWE